MCASVAGGGRSLRLITMNCDHITVNCNTQSITPPPPRPAPPAAVHVYCRLQRCTGHRSLATGPNTLVPIRGGDDRNHGEERNHRGSSPILVATIVALSQVRLQTNLCEVWSCKIMEKALTRAFLISSWKQFLVLPHLRHLLLRHYAKWALFPGK